MYISDYVRDMYVDIPGVMLTGLSVVLSYLCDNWLVRDISNRLCKSVLPGGLR